MLELLESTERSLNHEELEFYHNRGYLVVRGLFHPAEMAVVAMESERLLRRTDLMLTDNIRCRWQPHCDTGECLFETFDPVIDLSPVLSRLAGDPRLVGVLAQIYGEPARLFKDKLIFKPSGATGHTLHQDYIGWKDFPKSFITAAVAIDPATGENGCTEVYPGLHHNGYLSPEDGNYHPLAESVVAGVEPVPLIMEPGDVAFFGAFTPHRSAPNRSKESRKLLYLSYNAESDGGDRRLAHYAEFHDWLKVKYAEYGKTGVYFV